MNVKTVAILALRIISIILFIRGINILFNYTMYYIPTYLDQLEVHNTQSITIFIIPALIYFVLSILIWIFSTNLSRFIIPTDSAQKEENIQINVDLDKLQVIVISIVGLIIFILGISDFSRDVAQYIFIDKELFGGMRYNTQIIYPLIGSGVKTILGIILFFQAKGLKGLLKKIRDL